jgi:hypothetical protein
MAAMAQPTPNPSVSKAAGTHQITEALVRAAIDAYAPILVCHRHERYLPTCVESYLQITEPFTYVDRDTHKTYVGLRHRQAETDPSRQLDIVRGGDPAHAKAYVNVKVATTTTDLQFWFLYAYNGPATAYLKRLNAHLRYEPLGKGDDGLDPGDYELGDLGVHEGDWEHCTITIDNQTGKAIVGDNKTGLFLASHGVGQHHDVAKSMVSIDGASRIRVYASKNGHSSNLHPERSYHVTVKVGVVEFRLVNDTTLPGESVDFKDRCEIIGIQGCPELKASWNGGKGFSEPAYVAAFPGRWGRVREKPHPYTDVLAINHISAALLKAVGAYDELTFEAGPYPPWSKSSWTGPE